MTETLLVPAQLAYAYPRLAELAELRGDRRFAATLRRRGAELRAFVARQWTGRGWYARGFSGDRLIGSGAIFGEPQPWAVLAGVPTQARAQRLVANIRRFLTGIGAARRPEPDRLDDLAGGGRPRRHRAPHRLGPARATPATLVGASQFPGGVWFDVNGWLTWALSQLDGVVPRRAALRVGRVHAQHAGGAHPAFPDHWNGTISSDDACNGFYSPEPARCGIGGAVDAWAGEITEQPTWMVMNAIRLAGVTADTQGLPDRAALPVQALLAADLADRGDGAPRGAARLRDAPHARPGADEREAPGGASREDVRGRATGAVPDPRPRGRLRAARPGGRPGPLGRDVRAVGSPRWRPSPTPAWRT